MIDLLKRIINNGVPLCKVYVEDRAIHIKDWLTVNMDKQQIQCGIYYVSFNNDNYMEILDNLCKEYIQIARNY